MHTALCDVVGIEFPIFAFSHCRDVVAAVSKAGGLGVLGALAFSPEQLEIELNWIDEHVDGKPYGVDVVMPAKYAGAGELDPERLGDQLKEMITQQHRDWVDQLLAEHDVPELSEDDASPAGLLGWVRREGPRAGRDRARAPDRAARRTRWARRRRTSSTSRTSTA